MTDRRHKKMVAVLRARQPGLTVVMEDIHDPHNVSAILRSADAVGVLSVQLLYTKEKFPKLGKKSSASAVKWLTRRQFTSVEECFDQLRSEGFTVCATHLAKTSVSLYDLDLTEPVALVFGNEHRGVSDEASSKADVNFRIPMTGMIESLNVSVACAVSLYEAFRQRAAVGKYHEPALSPEMLKEILEVWKSK
jgi:tRNA (guanosine-2'-O-)-methyltransferase